MGNGQTVSYIRQKHYHRLKQPIEELGYLSNPQINRVGEVIRELDNEYIEATKILTDNLLGDDKFVKKWLKIFDLTEVRSRYTNTYKKLIKFNKAIENVAYLGDLSDEQLITYEPFLIGSHHWMRFYLDDDYVSYTMKDFNEQYESYFTLRELYLKLSAKLVEPYDCWAVYDGSGDICGGMGLSLCIVEKSKELAEINRDILEAHGGYCELQIIKATLGSL